MNEKNTSQDKDSSESIPQVTHEIIHTLHKYKYYTHSDWYTDITNEVVSCTKPKCTFRSYKEPSNKLRCPVCAKESLSVNVRLKANIDTNIIGEPNLPPIYRSLRSKYAWVFQELQTTTHKCESRFNGIVQFHNYTK